jgi:hypothetical protein
MKKHNNEAAANSSSNEAPLMIRINYSSRSMCRLHRKLVINSSAAHCVATADVMRNWIKSIE